ncbi:MAG: hypothetical protein K0S47_2354 [Herbinix sp.]|jgi:fucose 4-O-acetylase-like acetyltransferase|nr:hypothetical protein [Herbinix sp.]
MKDKLVANFDNTKEATRDYLFDNMRAALIILVVLGHILTIMITRAEEVKIVYFFIFFFHMPAMTFISGFFSKNVEKSRSTAFETLFLPYLYLNIFTYLYKMFIIQEEYFGFQFFKPLFGIWYLFVLFLWKFFLKDLVKIRFILPLSFIFGIVSGISSEFTRDFAMGRAICFLPFFLLGYFTTQKHIDMIRKIPKIVGSIIVIAVGALSYYAVRYDLFRTELLYLRKAFKESMQFEEMFYRGVIYIIALLMIFAMINLFSYKKNFLSVMGTRTMAVYIFHLFTTPILELFDIFRDQPYLYLLYSVVATAIIVYIYSRPIALKLYNATIERLNSLVLRKNQG